MLSLSQHSSVGPFSSLIPSQWKGAHITPIPKVQQPLVPSDYRPISITSVLGRVFEKMIVRQFIYPALNDAYLQRDLADQFAFRPTGSTTAAVISLLNKITSMLESNQYVRVIALDFSKAFDSIRHSELSRKLSTVPIGDQVYNWIINYIDNRYHCTKFNGKLSQPAHVNASVVQGSAIGPMSFIITARVLKPTTAGNDMIKYADDTYLLVSSCNDNTVGNELANISRWAEINNLQLNRKKSQKIIFYKSRPTLFPPPLDDIVRVEQLNVLGV